MEPNEIEGEPRHPLLKRHQERVERSLGEIPYKSSVDMEKVLAEFDNAFAGGKSSKKRWWRWLSLRGLWEGYGSRSADGGARKSVRDLLRLPFPLVGAGAALVLLVAVLTTEYRGGKGQIIQLDVPGERSGVASNAPPFSGQFSLEISSKMDSIRVKDGQLSCKGALVRQSRPDAGVVIFNFTAKSDPGVQQQVVIKDGVLKLRLKDSKGALSKFNIVQGHVSGIVLPGQSPLERDFFL